jgi:uncharacterized protein YndB with AHSA1/START domain
MSTVRVERTVDATVDRVWAVFTELDARASYLSTVDGVQVVTTGPFDTGTVWRETRTAPDGAELTEEFRVTECVPGRCFTVASPGIGADYRLSYTFTPIEVGRHRGASTVSVVLEGTPVDAKGRLLAFVFGALAARTVEGALRRDLDDLSAVVVADAPVARPGPAA